MTPIDCTHILQKYFEEEPLAVVLTHSSRVADLATGVARRLKVDAAETAFIGEAALLHDIGTCRVHAPGIGLYGEHPYLLHGVLGRQILEQEGLNRHALVCERHIGVGLTAEEIIARSLPLPHRDMLPLSLAEQIVCFADLFYSKTPGKLEQMATPEQVRRKLAVFGDNKAHVFDSWLHRFGSPLDFT